MKTIAEALSVASEKGLDRDKAQKKFLRERGKLWRKIQDGNFPSRYLSTGNRLFTGAPARTAIRCDFLLASQSALGAKYRKDKISDLAQRDLLFSVLRYREVFPDRRGNKFYCCVKCTGKLHECVAAKVFRYIDNDQWKKEIERPTAIRGKSKRRKQKQQKSISIAR